MLRAPEAPAPTVMAKSEITPTATLRWPGATSMPQSAVNTTRDITRGFNSSKKSRGVAFDTAAKLPSENDGCSVTKLIEPGSS